MKIFYKKIALKKFNKMKHLTQNKYKIGSDSKHGGSFHREFIKTEYIEF